MNSRQSNHDYFEKLSSLAALGQISEAEFHELQEHLSSCDHCRGQLADFTEVLHEHLPLVAPQGPWPTNAKNVAFHDATYKQRFLKRAQSEGLTFSQSITGNIRPRPGFSWSWHSRRLAYSAALLALGISAGIFGERHWNSSRPSLPAGPFQEVALVRQQNADLKQQLGDLRRELSEKRSLPAHSSPAKGVDPEITQLLSRARSDYAAAVMRSKMLDDQLEEASNKISVLQAQLRKSQADNSDTLRLSDTEEALKKATKELQELRKERSVYASTFSEQQTQIRELMEKVSRQKETLEREQELMAAGRDIRELMGAPNLHIIDVFDFVDGRNPRRPVGRVFYTEGKSLLFYAYDLEKKRKSLEKYSFQAWGQREAKGGSVESLGVFVADDQGQNRWVLKYSDPQVLAQIDSVFVTIEPKGGSDRPQGQQLLYAYLKANPNHP